MSRNGTAVGPKDGKKKFARKGRSIRSGDLAGSEIDNPENLELADEAEMTWADLFGDGSEQTTIELIRMAPAFVGDVPCTGFCGNVQPGASLQTIKELYGGGKYKLQKKVNGAFVKGGFRYLEIVGTPIIPAKQTAVLASESVSLSKPVGSAGTGPAAAGTITVDGLTLPADFAAFKQSIMEIMLLKSALREPDPLNTRLLELVLNQAAPKDDLTAMLGTIDKIKSVASEFAPASASGDGWMMLLNKGLDAFGSFMKAKQITPAPGKEFAGAPDFREVTTGNGPALLPERTGEMPAVIGDQMSLQQKIQAGLSIIVAGFKLQPAKEIPAVVEILNDSLGIPVADRASLLPFKRNLFDKAELMLADEFACADDPGEPRGRFALYFDQIFNEYCGVTE